MIVDAQVKAGSFATVAPTTCGDSEVMIGFDASGIACAATIPVLTGLVDNGDGTVTDHDTGLMWEKKEECAAIDLSNPHCKLNTYTWTAGTTAPDGTLYTDFLKRLNDLKAPNDGDPDTTCFAGHCDWRTPIIGELRSILLAEYDCSPNCIDPIFGPTQAYYWSSSSKAGIPTDAWTVLFNNGLVPYSIKTTTLHARAVRIDR